MTFNLGTLFSTFYGVASGTVPLLIIIWTLGNFAGPVILGRFFDTVGRKPMIAGCYLGSAALTIPLIVLFVQGTVNEWGFLANLVAIFFVASAGASAAYLTVSEVFPMETRALAIAFFYAVGTGAGGIVGPILFGQLIGTGDRGLMAIAFIVSAGVMTVGGIAEIFLGVRAERSNLENIAKPLTAREAEEEDGAGAEAGGGQAERHRQTAQQRREEAERARGRAADYRAAALEREPDGEEDAGERRRVDEELSEAAELRAQALEEQAAAYEELATAVDAADEHTAAAARSRAQAAEQRARGLAERERGITAGRAGDEDGYVARAEAAGERARAREQRALAEEARGAETRDSAALQQARAAMHDAWAEMHEARARMQDARASGDAGDQSEHERAAAEAERRALAAEQRVAAEEHRVAAGQLREEREAVADSEAEQAGAEEAAGEEAADARRLAEEREQRIRERVSARLRREWAGRGRFRPGPGSMLQSGRSGGLDLRVTTSAEEALDREISAIARALEEQGPTDRQELARLVGARYWGPGRFGAALRSAVVEGRARRLSRRTYGPPE
ncbi:MAG: MFS transporter, partial [Actinomycetota bacterium]